MPEQPKRKPGDTSQNNSEAWYPRLIGGIPLEVMDGNGDRVAVIHNGDERTAGIIVSAVNSYRFHCGPNAVEAAENDLLGELLHAASEMLKCTGGHENWNGETERCLKLLEAAIAKATT